MWQLANTLHEFKVCETGDLIKAFDGLPHQIYIKSCTTGEYAPLVYLAFVKSLTWAKLSNVCHEIYPRDCMRTGEYTPQTWIYNISTLNEAFDCLSHEIYIRKYTYESYDNCRISSSSLEFVKSLTLAKFSTFSLANFSQ